jgi:hypothetical protein
MAIQGNLYCAQAAIYEWNDTTSDWHFLVQSAMTEFNYSGQDWFAFNFSGDFVELHGGVNYLVVLWTYSYQDYGMYLRFDDDYDNHNGFVYQDDWYRIDDQTGEFPSALDGYCGDNIKYSLYCSITPNPPP